MTDQPQDVPPLQEFELRRFLETVQMLMETRDADAMMLFATLPPPDKDGNMVPNLAVHQMSLPRTMKLVAALVVDLEKMVPPGPLKQRLQVLAELTNSLVGPPKPSKIIKVIQ